MIVQRRNSLKGLLQWQWKAAFIYTLMATVIWAIHAMDPISWQIPTLPLTILGSALGIFVSFRSNAAYGRWWEARQLWGQLVNSSRHWAQQVMAYVPDPLWQHRLIRRQIAYVHVLRCQLRGPQPQLDIDVQTYLGGDDQELVRESNLCAALLARNLKAVSELRHQGLLSVYELQRMDETLATLLNVQGGCERIRNTPMPPSYGFLATRLTQVFGVLLPLSMVHEIGWRVIPLNALLCLAFTLINEFGRILEEPFTFYWNAMPLQALSRTIEINLLERLGEEKLPEPIKPIPPGVLL